MTVFRITGFNDDWIAVVEALSAYDAKKKVLENRTNPVWIQESDISKWRTEVIANGVSYVSVSA
jgi:hypothetical protein